MGIQVENQKLLVGGCEFLNYQIKKEIGSGANGIVYLAENLTLGRNEALKVWIKRRKEDTRNKLVQGLYEIQKLAKVDGK